MYYVDIKDNDNLTKEQKDAVLSVFTERDLFRLQLLYDYAALVFSPDNKDFWVVLMEEDAYIDDLGNEKSRKHIVANTPDVVDIIFERYDYNVHKLAKALCPYEENYDEEIVEALVVGDKEYVWDTIFSNNCTNMCLMDIVKYYSLETTIETTPALSDKSRALLESLTDDQQLKAVLHDSIWNVPKPKSNILPALVFNSARDDVVLITDNENVDSNLKIRTYKNYALYVADEFNKTNWDIDTIKEKFICSKNDLINCMDNPNTIPRFLEHDTIYVRDIYENYFPDTLIR